MKGSLEMNIDMDLDAFLLALGAAAPGKAYLRHTQEAQLAAALAATPPQFLPVPAGFSAPVSTLPAVCTGGAADTALALLDGLVDDVAEAKTFEAWLESQL